VSRGKHNRQRSAQRSFSPADLLNLWQPNGACEEYSGLAYGKGPRQKLDVYKPRHAAMAPVLVFFYGGSWQRGSRDFYRFVGVSLAAQGIVTVVPDYSIFPPARFPMFVEDAARAVGFTRKSAAQWGANPSRLVLMGHSAGAYIAAMLSFDPQWLGQVDIDSRTDLAGFIGLAGTISCQSRAGPCAPFSAAPTGQKRSRSPSSPVRKRPRC
jgi:acetyl esterase/lipase